MSRLHITFLEIKTIILLQIINHKDYKLLRLYYLAYLSVNRVLSYWRLKFLSNHFSRLYALKAMGDI